MAMMPSPRKPGNGRVPTPRVPGKPGKPVKGPGQVVRPVPTKPPAKAPGRAGKSPVPPGYTRVRDAKGGFKIIKAKPGMVYMTGAKSAASKVARKPR